MFSAEINTILNQKLPLVEAEIRAHLDWHNPFISQVGEHIISSGGKRLRPMLLLICSGLCGYQGEQDILIAGIMEYVHAATLLHDDVLDEAVSRRGQPSANSKWGINVPILVGDYLFAKLTNILAREGLPHILRIVTDTVMLITEGELLEIGHRWDTNLSEEMYLEIARKKTASLISACCEVAAALAGTGHEGQTALREYGYNLGLAYQLVDDLLDLVGQEKTVGKPVGNDLREGNLTVPLIYALRQAKSHEVERVQDILQPNNGLHLEMDFIQDFLQKYQGIEYTKNCAQAYIAQAQANLSQFADSPFRQALWNISEYILKRQA